MRGMLLGLILLLYWGSLTYAQEKIADNTIDAKTIAEYKKLGAKYGAFSRSWFGSIDFSPDVEIPKHGIHGFQFNHFESGKLPLLPKVDHFFGLDFSYSKITDADLERVTDFPFHLILLNLAGTKITDIGLTHVEEALNLTVLNLYGTTVTDDGMKHLSKLRTLKHLFLDGTKVTDLGLKELKKNQTLQELYLRDLPITDRGLKELKELTGLKILDFGTSGNVSGITDKGLKELKDLKNLSILTLNSNQITDEGLKELGNLRNLTELTFNTSRVTNNGLKELKSLENLTKLKIFGPTTLDGGWKHLQDLKKLTHLDFREDLVTDNTLKELLSHHLLHRWIMAIGEKDQRPSNLDEIITLSLFNTQTSNSGLEFPTKNGRAVKKIEKIRTPPDYGSPTRSVDVDDCKTPRCIRTTKPSLPRK